MKSLNLLGTVCVASKTLTVGSVSLGAVSPGRAEFFS